MKVAYKEFPLRPPHPAFPQDQSIWHPVLPVRLNNPAAHRASPAVVVWVDSGAPYCYFHANIGRSIGLEIESGAKGFFGGVVPGGKSDAYFHNITLFVGSESVRVRAGFSDDIAVAGLLGRNGFFDNYIVTFDQSSVPPHFELRRVSKS